LLLLFNFLNWSLIFIFKLQLDPSIYSQKKVPSEKINNEKANNITI